MNIKDAYIHVGPSGTNEKALLKDFIITAAQITLTRAIQNDAGTGDKTETITVPIWNQDTTGNADTATKLATARTISLTGSVTGSGTFDGSGDLSITTTTNHSHNYVNAIGKSGATITWAIDGAAQTALDFSTTFAPYNANGYLPLSGGTMTGTITRIYDSATDSPTISVQSKNQNVWIWRVKDKGTGSATSTSAVYGFGLKYLGVQGENNNSLGLYADNQTGTQILAMEVKQNGNIIFSQNVTADKFIKSGGTSSQFLKADGSIDSNSYLISSTDVTTATWTAKTDDVNYPIAFSPNATPTTSGNGYNTGFTFNPGVKTFNNNGCRQQYDSTNKVLKFIFD